MISGAIAGIGGAHAQEIPSNLQIVGRISSGASGITPVENDVVRVTNVDTGATEGAGTIVAIDGTYFVDLSKTTDFNGTQLTLRLRTGGDLFQLDFGSDSTFPYSGGFPFPVRITINPTIGQQLSGGGGGGGGGGGPAPTTEVVEGLSVAGTDDERFDCTGDGLFNQADIDFIKAAITSSDPDPCADVNGDGIVNTRDAVNAIRKLFSVTDRTGSFVSGE